jgi:hypothetical protein
MTYRIGYQDFFHNFRGKECIIVFKSNDPGDWWIAPLNEDGSEGESIMDLTSDEEETLAQLVADVKWDWDNDY